VQKNYLPAAIGRLIAVVAAALGTLYATAAIAADPTYPSRPLRVVVPYAAGGTADVAARLIAQKLTARLGQSVVVDNKPGAGGVIGMQAALAWPADGYTIVRLASGYEWLPAIHPKLPFDPVADFSPVAMIGGAPYIFITHPSRPYRTLPEFIRHAKDGANKVSYSTAGIGTLHHLLGALFQSQAGIRMTDIPFSGAAPAEANLIAGHVDVMFDPIGLASPQIKAQLVRPLATTGAKRPAGLPDVPTFEELGIPLRASFWLGLAVRTGVDAAIVNRLNTEINAALREPDVTQRFNDLAFEADPRSPADFSRFLRDAARTYGTVVRESGIKPPGQ